MASPKSRSDRMRSIQALSDREAQNLAARMEQQAGEVRLAEARLAELEDFFASYVADHTAVPEEGISAMRLSETHVFLQRLKSAVELQHQSVEQARGNYEASRARWIAQHVRTSTLGSVVHRLEREEVIAHARQEQQVQDEFAARDHQKREESSDERSKDESDCR